MESPIPVSGVWCLGVEIWCPKSILNVDCMGSLQLLFPSGTGWNLSLHVPTVTVPISSTWRARAMRFFSPYFPAFCRSFHLPLYCEVFAKDSIYGYKEGWDRGRGRRRVGLSMPGELPMQGLGWGPLPLTCPASNVRHTTAPRIPFAGSGYNDCVEDALRASPMQGRHITIPLNLWC
jgi:hypothetical protein